MSAAAKRVAVVVGGIRGNGWGVTRHLIEQTTTPLVVYATGHPVDIAQNGWLKRNPNATSSIDSVIEQKGCELKNTSLEIGNPDAIAEFSQKLVDSHGPECVSVLVNASQYNRKIGNVDEHGTDPLQSVLKEVYWGSKNLAKAIIPLMKRDGNSRVVHLSTPKGSPSFLKENLAKRFRGENITWEQLDGLMKEYADAIRTRHYADTDWPPSESATARDKQPFNISKIGVAAMVFPLSREYPGILINACRPESWRDARDSPTLYKLATGDIDGVTGGFWENGKLSTW
ncbi:hypothetical protein TWF696_007771 [Orbilia brochopaga]|uniref:Uncharacterized protein n=1 Tax=Orbilia brochopaga TaxID=3140254 RepID=A0AAV9ULB7_9PEZI